jgi:hypothetical protein
VRSSGFGRRAGLTVRASYPHPTLKYWCALSTTSPGQSRGRAGASPLTAGPTVPACRPAYAADATCHWATRDNSTGSRLSLCKIAHAHHVSTGLARQKREWFSGAWGWKASCPGCELRPCQRRNSDPSGTEVMFIPASIDIVMSPLSCSGVSFSPASCRFSSRMICSM